MCYLFFSQSEARLSLQSPRLSYSHLPERSSAKSSVASSQRSLNVASAVSGVSDFFQKAKSSAETPLFLPGHLFSPAVVGKSLHFSLFQRCVRRRPVPGQVHAQAPRNFSLWSISFLRVLQSEHVSFPLRPRFFQWPRSMAANFVWPRFPQMRQVYWVVSFGE